MELNMEIIIVLISVLFLFVLITVIGVGIYIMKNKQFINTNNLLKRVCFCCNPQQTLDQRNKRMGCCPSRKNNISRYCNTCTGKLKSQLSRIFPFCKCLEETVEPLHREQEISPTPSKKPSTAKRLNTDRYITLDDHLNEILDRDDEPEYEIKEKTGQTMEFLPDDNTVIKVEGTQSRITRITKTKITIGDVLSQHEFFSIHTGELHQDKILVYVVPLYPQIFEEIKNYIMDKDSQLPTLIQHPRYVRYLGTCFNHKKYVAYVLSDYIAGCTLLDYQKTKQLREVLRITEEEKLEGAVDVAESVYYLHNLSSPITHQHIATRNILVDGKTLRFRLRAPEIQSRVEDMVWCAQHGGIKDYLDRSNMLHMEQAPELILSSKTADLKSDIWALGAVILEILLEKKLWDVGALRKGADQTNIFDVLREAMVKRLSPSILSELEKVPKLKFLSDCFQYSAPERPSSTFILRGMQQFLSEAKEMYSRGNGVTTSVLFPGRRIQITNIKYSQDPLVRQQVEWNVRQERGMKRRTLLIGNRNYLGKEWATLSANPMNDIKDVSNLLAKGGYGTNNYYENINSTEEFASLVSSYVDAVNKDPEDIDILLFYYSGYGIQGIPESIEKKLKYGIFSEEGGIIYDTALVMCNETMFPVAKLQVIISNLNPRVKRRLLVLDTRIKIKAGIGTLPNTPGSFISDDLSISGSSHFTNSSKSGASKKLDWEVGKIPEETEAKLNSMFTLRTIVTDPNLIPKAVDSHPRRMNGYLTGCFIQVMKGEIPNISELPRFLTNQMQNEARRSRAHKGIECKAEYSNIGNIWDAPLVAN